jgi:hypothetical protein
MPEFKIGEKIETAEPRIEVTIDPANPLRPGTYRFQLVVVDDSGNESDPAFVNVVVRDTQRPTAVIDAPEAVEVGQTFEMTATRSFDAPGGQIVRYVWTLLG